MTEQQPQPPSNRLLQALTSRRVIVAEAALIVGLLILLVPSLAPLRGEILTLIVTLALAVVGSYSLEDAARAGRNGEVLNGDELRELIEEVVSLIAEQNRLTSQPDNAQQPPKEE